MPRQGPYVYWSSRNVAILEGYNDVNELDWRSTWKPEVRNKPKTIEQVKEQDGTSTLRNETYAGRAHREEAMLVQVKGTNNQPACMKCQRGQGCFGACRSVGNLYRGACACCIWQSKQLDCSLAREAFRQEAESAAQLAAAKEKMKELRAKPKASSKNSSPIGKKPRAGAKSAPKPASDRPT